MQPPGHPMNAAQLQELQELQRLQQEMESRMRQQQSSQSQGGGGMMQQPQQQQQQRWLEQQMGNQQQGQRNNSFAGGGGGGGVNNNNSVAMFLMQQQQQQRRGSSGSLPLPPSAGTTNPTNARASLYMNVMQANNAAGGSGNIMMGNAQAPGAMGANGDPQRRGSLNTMEALLLQQQQQRGSLGGMSGVANVNSALASAQRRGSDSSMNSMQALLLQQQQQQQAQHQQQSLGGSSASLLGALSNSQPQMAAASTSDQLLMQQQRIMAELKRKLQQQQQQEMAVLGRRGAQQRQAMFQMQQRQNSLSSTSSMGGGMPPGHVRSQSQSSHGSGAAAAMLPPQGDQQRRSSVVNVEPIPLASLMGGGGQPQSPPQVRRGSGGLHASLGNNGGGLASMPGAPSMLTQQQQQAQMQQQQLQQQLLSGMLPLQDSPESQRRISQSSRQLMPGPELLGGVSREMSVDSNATTKHSNRSEKNDTSQMASPNEQSFMDGTFEGGWQSNADIPERRQVIYDIVKLVEQMRPDSETASKKLPQMAKRLEEHLYRAARTKEEYLDSRTLKLRLQNVAHSLEMNRSAPVGDQATIDASQSGQGDPRLNEAERRTKTLQQQLQQMHQLQKLQQQGTMEDYLNQQAKLLQMQQAGLASVSNMTQSHNRGDASGIQIEAAGLPQESTHAAASSQLGILKKTSKYQDPKASQKRHVIKQQQQRLLLLRHASKCKAGPSCKTKHCGQMVKLWQHMKKCRDKNCKTPHCLSSRCVLNHYRMCKNANTTSTCEVCAPVMQLVKVQQLSEEGGDESVKNQADSAAKMPPNPAVPGEDSQKRRQLEELEAKQQKLQQQQMLLEQVKQQQAQLLEQQEQLREQLQHVQPHTQQAAQLQQQGGLLDQLQNLFQQQQLLLQQEVSEAMEFLEGASQSDQKLLSSAGRLKSSRGRGAGKGKHLKAMEAVESEQGMDGSVGGMDDPMPVSRKRPFNRDTVETETEGVEGSRSSKMQRLEQNPDSHPKVVEQGDPDHTTSLIQSMPIAAVERHLASLNDRLHVTPQTISQRCLPIVRKLIDDKFGWVFRDPVDPVALSLPDYYDIVKNPMHLSLAEEKLRRAEYPDIVSFANDIRLVFNNAILYNGDDSEVGEMAAIMLRHFEKDLKAVQKGIERDQRSLHRDDACILCGVQRRLFEPVTLYCNGACGMQRIRRNATYYTDHTKMNHWCTSCFANLDGEELIMLEDGSEVRKSALQKFKNDGLPEEAWVQCDDCKGWVHQICALFNGRRNKNAASYQCPKCHIDKSRQGLLDEPEKRVKVARDLPHSKMSEAIENGLHKTLEEAHEKRAAELGVDVSEVEKADGLFVRVVSNMEKKHVVRDEMYKRYAKDGAASEFPVRSKCIALFQTIDGVDVILFAMYVYEYDDKCPAPNRRRVYVSYLDSVCYFQPKYYRTIAYHALIVEYLRYVKERGFHTAHIWSCPPSDGDDYVFYCHPKEQLVPREDMLLKWYHRMLEKAKNAGIVLETRTLYDEYFSDNDGVRSHSGSAAKPTCLPYFEGDYIPGEIENIIKQIKEENAPQDESSGPQDEVMKRLGQALYNMRQNFMVVRMRSKDFVSAVDNGEDVTGWIDVDGDAEESSGKRIKIGSKDSNCLSQLPAHQRRILEDVASGSGTSSEENTQGQGEIEAVAVSTGAVIESNNADASKPPSVTHRPIDNGEGKESKMNAESDEATDHDAKSTVESNEVAENNEKAEGQEKVEDTPQSSTSPEHAKESSTTLTEPLESAVSTGVPNSDDVSDIPVESNATSAVKEEQVETKKPDETTEKDQVPAKPTEHSNGSSKPNDPTNEEELPVKANQDGENAQNDVKVEDTQLAESIPDSDSESTGIDSDLHTNATTENFGPTGSNPSVDTTKQESERGDPAEPSHSTSVLKAEAAEVVVEPDEQEHVPSPPGDLAKGDSSETNADDKTDPVASASTEKQEATKPESTIQPSTKESSFKTLKRGIEELGPALSRHFASARNNAKPVGTTEDEDEPQETEMFESRQQFLNYCQANHFQFDELRRAKHSSMMVLFQLHNPSAPMFLQQCGACYRDITHGVRYHCNDCSNFDLCQDCYEPVTTGLWAKRDSRFTHNKRHTFVAIDMEAPASSQKSRDERTRTIKMHLELLSHAATCDGPPDCSLNNCQRMKKLFEHVNSCEVTYRKGCKVCSRLLSLLTMHARMCTVRGSCPLPFCDRIRERNKRRKQQQQLMDDRRRQAQNALYRGR